MADEPETMASVRARANSHDGCPTDVFDRALVAHDARVARDAAVAALRAWAAGVDAQLDASAAEGIDLGDWGRGLRSGVQQARETADQFEKESQA